MQDCIRPACYFDSGEERTRAVVCSSFLTARRAEADCTAAFPPRMEKGIPHLSQATESRRLSSVDPDNAEGMIHLKEAEGIAFQK